MALFQTGTGYRDATKALTIKALQERQKQAAAATAAASEITQPMIDPLQGMQHLSGVLSGVVGQNRADSQEGEARQRLAGIMAGIDPTKGATMQQIAEMQTLDPEFANKQYEAAQKARTDAAAQEDQQAFLSGESATQRQAAIDLSKQGAAQDITKLGKQDEIGDVNAAEAARVASEEKQRQEAAQVAETQRQEALPQVDQAKIIDAFNRGDFGDPTTPDAIAQKDAALAKANASSATNITTNVGGGKKLDETLDTEEGKIWTGHQKERNVAAGSQKDMSMLGELAKQAPQGPILGTLASQPILKNFSNAGVAFNSIVKRVAPTLRVEGSGSTSDIEYQGMLDSLPDLANYPEANQLIIGMMQAKSAINIERGNIVDSYRNGEITDIQARQQLAAVNQRTIMNPELEALFQKISGVETETPADAGAGGSADVDEIIKRANQP